MDVVNLILSTDETVYLETPYLLEVGPSREGLRNEMILVVSAVKV